MLRFRKGFLCFFSKHKIVWHVNSDKIVNLAQHSISIGTADLEQWSTTIF